MTNLEFVLVFMTWTMLVSINKIQYKRFCLFYIRHITSAHLTFSKTIYEFGDHKVKISSKISKLKTFKINYYRFIT